DRRAFELDRDRASNRRGWPPGPRHDRNSPDPRALADPCVPRLSVVRLGLADAPALRPGRGREGRRRDPLARRGRGDAPDPGHAADLFDAPGRLPREYAARGEAAMIPIGDDNTDRRRPPTVNWLLIAANVIVFVFFQRLG